MTRDLTRPIITAHPGAPEALARVVAILTARRALAVAPGGGVGPSPAPSPSFGPSPLPLTAEAHR